MICLGDLLESDAASRFPNEASWTLRDEYESAADYLQQVMEVGGNEAEYVWLHGNHDDNIRAKGRIDPRIRDLCDWDHDRTLGTLLKSWKQVPYSARQSYRLGPVTFAHGAQHGVNSDRDQAVLYGTENGLYVSGHTHRGRDVQQALMTSKIPLRYWFANAGCTVDWKRLSYMDRKSVATWTHGYVYGESNATQHRANFASIQWDARHVVHKRGH